MGFRTEIPFRVDIDMPSPTDTIIRDYRVLRTIGRGSSGTVVLAENLPSLDQVALKISPARRGDSESAGSEFRLLSKLDHPRIVRAREEFVSEKNHVIALDLIRGFSLAELLDAIHQTPRDGLRTRDALNALSTATNTATGANAAIGCDLGSLCNRLPNREPFDRFAARVARDVALALDHAHSRSVFHRDVKPENILIDESGSALLADFSVATESPEDPSFTGGTLSYMPASQLTRLAGLPTTPSSKRPKPSSARRSDLYALGIVLYELLTSDLPYPAAEATDSVIAAAREALPTRQNAVARVRRDATVDEALRQVIIGCLKSPETDEDGYDSANDLVEDLESWLEGRPLTHVPEPLPSRMRRHMKSRRRTLTMVLTITALLLTTIGVDRKMTLRRLNDVEQGVYGLPDEAILNSARRMTQRLFQTGLLPDDTALRHKRARLAHALSIVHLRNDQPNQATELLERAAALNADSADIRNDLGAARFRMREFDLAVRAFNQSLRIDANQPRVLSNRGAAFAAMNDADRARDDFERALRIDPHCQQAIRHMELLGTVTPAGAVGGHDSPD